MSDVTVLARRARENLSAALGALQSPGVPEALLEVAQPIAKAMGLMHQLERNPESVQVAGPVAFRALRNALDGLQVGGFTDDATCAAIDGVTGAYSSVYRLSHLRSSDAPRVVAAVVAASPQVAQPLPAPQPQVPVQSFIAPQARAVQPIAAAAPYAVQPPVAASPVAAPVISPQPQVVAPREVSVAAAQTRIGYAASPPAGGDGYHWSQVPAPQNPPVPLTRQVQQPAQPTTQQYAYQPTQAQPQFVPPAQAPQAPRADYPYPGYNVGPSVVEPPAAAAPKLLAQVPVNPGAALQVEAALGAHSTTNFYKGLSGNDVIESGGIFIATYNIPPIGQLLQLKVSMPGGFEFGARAVVRWSRESPKSSSMAPHAPPGYGAQFIELTNEARQLIYRYVRNREPLFHDAG